MQKNLTSVQEAFENLLFNTLGVPKTEGTEETPFRVTKMILELFEGLYKDISYLDNQMTLFSAPKKPNTVEIKGIPFYSVCEHHMLPFFGFVDIIYTPRKYILGLSKFNRIVRYFSRKPQVQERLTQEVAQYIFDLVQPKDVKVILRDCRHMCMEMRGVNQPSNTSTEILLEAPNRLEDNASSLRCEVCKSKERINRIREDINRWK